MNINLDSAKDVLCKNILIYGYCKFQDKGCAFSHNKQLTTPQQQQQQQKEEEEESIRQGGTAVGVPGSQRNKGAGAGTGAKAIQSNGMVNSQETQSKRRFDANSPLFQPAVNNAKGTAVTNLASKFSNLSPRIRDAPVFKPENESPISQELNSKLATSGLGSIYSSKKFNASTPSFTPTGFDFSVAAQVGNNPGSTAPANLQLQQKHQQHQQQPQQHQQQQQQQLGLQNLNQTQLGRNLNVLLQPQISQPFIPANAIPPSSAAGQLQLHMQVQQPQAQTQPPSHLTPSSIMSSAPMSAGFYTSALPIPQGGGMRNQPPSASMYPLQYHLYAPAPPPRLAVPTKEYETDSQQLFLPNELRESLHRKNEASLQTMQHLSLPDHVNSYHSLVPIDKSYDSSSKIWPGKSTVLFKCNSNFDGNLYALRKIEPCNEIVDETPFRNIRKWKSLHNNANIVALRDAFTTMAFSNTFSSPNSSAGNDVVGANGASLCFVYDYHPNLTTLLERHKKGIRVVPITEDLLWSYLTQLVNAVAAIHAKKLALRSTIDLSKIINTTEDRIKLSACGISEVLSFSASNANASSGEEDEEREFARLRALDIVDLGKVLLELSALLLPMNLRASLTSTLLKNLANSTKLSQNFLDVLQVLTDPSLLQEPYSFDMDQFILQYLSSHFMTLMNKLQNSHDWVELQLSTELENARLFRLMTKINFIISEMPTYDLNSQNRLKIIKVFQENLFNSVGPNGKKVVNMDRVLVNLNKLDCGIDEKTLLISDKECMIITFKEIKELIDTQFRLLRG